MRILFLTAVAAAMVVPTFAQTYEFGVAGGGSFYNSRSVSNSSGSASAGFDGGWTAGVNIGHNMYQHLGGEIRYMYESNGAKLSGNGGSASFGAQEHLVHYDFLLHTASTESNMRPYIAFGGGMKYFRGTGTEVAVQPLSNVALLTKTNEWKGMASVGAGVKIRVTEHALLRLDIHDYITPFPSSIIAPAQGSSIGGVLNNIVVSLGLGLTN